MDGQDSRRLEEGEIDMISKSGIRVVAVSDYEELSREAARRIIAAVRQHPASVLGLATGSTPEGTYRELVRDHQEKGTSYRRVTTFNLDEYVGLAADNPHSYHAYMEQHLFRHLDISRERDSSSRWDGRGTGGGVPRLRGDDPEGRGN